MALPSAVGQAVARRLFADMERLGWGGMTQAERSSQYAKWIQDQEIGGRLTQFMTPERARVWIKDGPVKEYPRALAGSGKYAELVEGRGEVLAGIVRHSLGANWVPDSGTLQTKPLRVVARRGDAEVVVAWGPWRDVKHLAWAALVAQAKGDSREWVLALTETFTNPVGASDKTMHSRLARRLSLRIVHVTVP